MCRRRLYFAGPAPRSETAGASPVAVVIGIIGDVDIVSMVRFTVGRVEEFIHASLSETEEGFVSSAKKSVMANRRGGTIHVQSRRPTFPVQLRRSCNSAQALHCRDCGSVHFHGLATLRAAFPWIVSHYHFVIVNSVMQCFCFMTKGRTSAFVCVSACIIDDGMSNVSVDQFHLSILSDFTFLIDDDRENISAHGLILRRKD
ncbi:hypothetical protein Q3G72_011792 [Acer saccharum]|nr:hypothetical protein Q3G72_011792 [Acer saccharum]